MITQLLLGNHPFNLCYIDKRDLAYACADMCCELWRGGTAWGWSRIPCKEILRGSMASIHRPCEHFKSGSVTICLDDRHMF